MGINLYLSIFTNRQARHGLHHMTQTQVQTQLNCKAIPVPRIVDYVTAAQPNYPATQKLNKAAPEQHL